MLSATDVSRNTGRFLAQAADGRRLVVMNNHQPVAALIGMADLRRLDDLDTATRASSSAGALPSVVSLGDVTSTVGRIPLGLTASGVTVSVDPLESLLVAGRNASDVIDILLHGVAVDGLDVLVVIVAERPAVLHRPVGILPRIAAVTTRLDAASADRISEQIAGALAERIDLLARHNVNTVDQYRATIGREPFDHLIVIIDGADELFKHEQLRETVTQALRNGADVGVSVWLFGSAPPRFLAVADTIGQRVALRTATNAESRAIVGIADAKDLSDGEGIALDINGSPTPFAFLTDADGVPWEGLEPVGDGQPGQWPAVPEPPTVAELVRRWPPRTDSGPLTIPVGVIDDVRSRRHVPFCLDLASDTRLPAVVVAPLSKRRAVEGLLGAVMQSVDAVGDLLDEDVQRVRFYYVGSRVPRADVRCLADAIDLHSPRVEEFTAAIRTSLTDNSGDAVVLIIDDWRALKRRASALCGGSINGLEGLALDAIAGASTTQGLQLLPICYDLVPPELTSGDATIYLGGSDIANSAPTSVIRKLLRHLPDDPHHAATAAGHIVLATTS